MTEIHIDFRENALLAILKPLAAEAGVRIVDTNLKIGDVHVVNEAHGIHLVFERKTLSDLAASLKDGRYKEQKHRMLSQHTPKHLTYIIEGASPTATPDKYGISKSVFDGVYINTMYRDGIHVLHVQDTTDTAKWVLNVATKVHQNPTKFSSCESDKEYVSACKAKSRRIDNVDQQTCFLLQLCQIPGVSVKLAKTIQERYASMRGLITALTNSPHPSKDLAALPLIGPKKAQVIANFLLI